MWIPKINSVLKMTKLVSPIKSRYFISSLGRCVGIEDRTSKRLFQCPGPNHAVARALHSNRDLKNLSEILDTPPVETIEIRMVTTINKLARKWRKPSYFGLFPDFSTIFNAFNATINQQTEKKFDSFSLESPLLSSEADLQNFLRNLYRDVFEKRVFQGQINFFLSPCKIPSRSGDLYYWMQTLISSDERIQFLLEIKTRASLPTSPSDDPMRLPNLFYGKVDNISNRFSNSTKESATMSQTRVKNIVCQLIAYMNINDGIGPVKYALLSSYEATYILFLDTKQQRLLISPPLGKELFLRATLFVLALREAELFPGSPIRDVLNEIDRQVDAEFQRLEKTNLTSSKKKRSKKTWELLADAFYQYHPVIGSGDTSVVVKTIMKEKTLALKLVDIFKHEEGALEELKHEFKVLKKLERMKVPFVPRAHYYEQFDLWFGLGVDLIEGTCFQSFSDMSLEAKEACYERVVDLHRYGVMHGELEPWNFIIQSNGSGFKAYLIDFGAAELNADKEMLDKEMNQFMEILNLIV